MDDSTIFIAGVGGQLGTALKQKYPGACSADMNELDITQSQSVNDYDWSGIKFILNAAAYTNVDGAETPEGRIAAWKVNASAVSNLVKLAQKHDMTLLHISTDYVFDGTKPKHEEGENFSPLSVYGETKAAGDLLVSLLPKHYILRTSWVIGEGKNFVRTMLGLGQKGIEPTVVADQLGRLTFTSELVRAADHLLCKQAEYGTYNVSNRGKVASWSDITRHIFKIAGFELTVNDATTADYYKGKSRIAPRPLNSTFNLSKIESVGFRPSDWEEELNKYVLKELA
jgi:dTDP-4-dehydrorhamnose reductase